MAAELSWKQADMKAELGGGDPWQDLLHSAAVKAGKSPAAAKRVPRLSARLTRLTDAMPGVAQLQNKPYSNAAGNTGVPRVRAAGSSVAQASCGKRFSTHVPSVEGGNEAPAAVALNKLFTDAVH